MGEPPREPARASGTFLLGDDLPVPRLGLGAMQLTGEGVWGEPDDRRAAIRLVRRAVELGVRLIDTADSYGPGSSEEIVAEALAPYPAEVVIATKGGFERPGPDRWVTNGRPEHLRRALDASLQRLRLDRIDLYQLHRIDPRVPWEESVGTLVELRAAGKIRHIGLSEVGVDELEAVRTMTPVATVQNRYNLEAREWDAVVDHCASIGVGFMPWRPLGSGRLTGAAARIAARHGLTSAQLSLAWLLARSPGMLPIPGTSSIAHLEENVAAAGVTLDPEEVRELSGL